jgi:SAM-dependent methyltransferase
LWREEAARCIALAPAQLGPARFAHGGVSSAVLAEEDALPFPDLSFDRILLVHGLEAAENAGRLLRECWRVLRDDGRLLVVAPNRRGIWAQFDHTPFGHGRPYSPSQITRLLQAQMFRVERRDAALYVPPFTPLMRAGTAWEKAGRTICPARWAGLCLIEAEKDIFAAMPAGAVRLRRRVLLRA